MRFAILTAIVFLAMTFSGCALQPEYLKPGTSGLYEKAQQTCPRFLKGDVKIRFGDYEEAVRLFKSLRQDPSHIDPKLPIFFGEVDGEIVVIAQDRPYGPRVCTKIVRLQRGISMH